ncbi:lysine--tRNA ligase [Candidatus Nitrosocosmicus franklandus]|uniref:Lysine--tRNA ligase n=1 Tax=Candidatus Nitrosocosmicus franklandianus TaxID=1798806 RepID=A0A484I469_9ARCH|nr:lysine--tRNA ligase [Candidatus Nitrosocosmicus franklandus]VFJ12455.1 Lysine--tRNA ligase [Candidatus Nitrosocosmicus franklandus]
MSKTVENIIGKGTWIDKIANTIIEREKKLGRSTSLIRVESGLGASGIPHIGSMGDAVRAYGISLALQNLGFNSELIAFSDDLDGLRKVPHGMPAWLNEYICKPVSSIPDPFGDCHDSYGDHMSGLLLEGLDASNIKYIFKSGTKTYKEGLLADQTHTILSKSKLIGDKISESTGQQKYTQFLPYFPICEQCNRLYVANSIEYIPEERVVTYTCSGNTIGKKPIKGCGHNGQSKIDLGNGKLAWKVEFAARWQAFDIRFEAFGKDIMDSVKINDWVSEEILNFHHPLHAKYEMFLDKGGKKISKSAGNVLTPQMWLQYGTPQSLLLLLFKRISGTRHVGIDDIPQLMDEYDLYEDIYFGKVKEPNDSKRIKINGIYEYINHLNPPKVYPSLHIPYRILIQQAELFKNQTIESNIVNQIFERLKKYGLVKNEDYSNELLQKKINLAIRWARDLSDIDPSESNSIGSTISSNNVINYQQGQISEKASSNDTNLLTSEQKTLLEKIKIEFENLYNKTLKTPPEENSNNDSNNDQLAQEIQSIIFNNARSSNLQPKEVFRLFYRILINSEKGPRLGNYIADLGLQNVIATLEKKISSS